ncbi:nucleolar protein 8 [Coelomomyces lativittatus]|nr:nucleolar protein 8 [Coelomomyces lativittatus]
MALNTPQTCLHVLPSNTLEVVKNELKIYRMYLGGFKEPITSSDLTHLFRSFGTLQNIDFPISKNGLLRSFVHFDLISTMSSLSNCLSQLNKATWKGGRIQLQLSHAKKENVMTPPQPVNDVSVSTPWFVPPLWSTEKTTLDIKSIKTNFNSRFEIQGELAKKMDLIHEENMDLNPLWKRGRFGRPLALMRKMRRIDRSWITIDPVLYKHQLERLYLNPKPNSIMHLTWDYSSFHSLLESDTLSPSSSITASEFSVQKNEEKEKNNRNRSSEINFDSSSGCSLKEEKTDHFEQCNLISSQSASEENENQSESENENVLKLTLFNEEASEDKQDLNTIKASFEKRQFDGKLGEDLLTLQRKSKGDPRFQLSEEFAPTIMTSDPTSPLDSSTDLPISTEIDMETEMSKKILSEMFGSLPTSNDSELPKSSSSDLLGIPFYEPPILPSSSSSSSSIHPNSATPVPDLSTVFTKHGPTLEAKSFTLFGDLEKKLKKKDFKEEDPEMEGSCKVPWQSVPLLPKTTLMSPIFFQMDFTQVSPSHSFSCKGMSLGQRKWWWKQHRHDLLRQIKKQHATAVYELKRKQKFNTQRFHRVG